jgi:hypothetical protein
MSRRHARSVLDTIANSMLTRSGSALGLNGSGNATIAILK